MSFATDLVEVYLSANVLLAVGLAAVGRWTPVAARNLLLARIALLSCLLAPVAMSFVRPFHGSVLSTAADIDAAPLSAFTAETPAGRGSADRWVVASMTSSLVDAKAIAALALALGFLWHLGRLRRELAAARRIIRRAVRLRRCRGAEVVVSSDCQVPFSLRLWRRAYVVLPASIMGDPRAVAIAVAHESQHHRQGDCVFAYGVELLRAACFWNPLLHLWQRRLADLQEFSCDEALVGRRRFTPHEYGCCLLKVAQAAISPFTSSREFACAPGMARPGRGKPQALLLRRIEMLSRYSPAASRSPLLYLVAAVLVATPVGMAFAARGTIAGAHGEPPDQSTLDGRLQAIAEGELHLAMTRLQAKSAAALVMDPSSGRVLAFAEERTESLRESWTTRVLTPASTVKPFILAGAIEAGVASATSAYDCSQPLAIGGQVFRNWGGQVGKVVTATTMVASSVNVCAIRVAQDAGSEATRAVLGRFGLEPNWDTASSDALQLAHTALGDTEPTTIGQLTRAFAILANLGHIPGAGAPSVISQTTALAVRRGLVEAVRAGTGRSAGLPGIQVAGKTGTSVTPGEPASHLAMFGGFAPAEHPSYVAFVVVEDGLMPSGERASGGDAAAPLFREIMRRSFLVGAKD